MPLLSLQAVEASYGAIRALRGVTIDVEQGSIVTLLGANGAGKSTTLKTISGMMKVSSGSISYEGQSISGRTPNQLVKMGIAQVPEGRRIFKDLSVTENLRMGSYIRKDKAGIESDLNMVFELFPVLKNRWKQLGGSLSGGEQQMLAIGRGLMARPKLLLLDEPSLGLAPIIVSAIFETIQRVNKENGTTLLIVEQNANIAMKNSSFGYVMEVGKIAIAGDSSELQNKREVINSYLGIRS
ncbi:MAG: branched-chain amino acid ABC transporter ATP-binding protein [Acidiferrobacteraceae bacterium]|nr:branched-chain amino acid ABC transporter ATP-binding protein [Acidiferrobacteraceae bacterium]|tara:strand:+ start:14255 stop:14974 length:720 start_codon:yes stop_codon:yes gene_type:complete